MPRLELTLKARAPFRLDLTVWALRRRAHNLIDRLDNGVWRRVVVLDGQACGRACALTVSQVAGGKHPEIQVIASGQVRAADRDRIEALVTKMLGLDRDLSPFYEIAERDPMLAPIAARLRGMKPVRFPSIFEAFGNAITCQQLSLSAGLHVLARMSAAFGISAGGDSLAMRSFAEPSLVANASEDELRTIGQSRPKARYLIDLARLALDTMDPDFRSLEQLSDSDALARLCTLRGIGRWSAEYVLLRGLGRIHIFPGDDVGAQNSLAKWLGLKTRPGYDQVRDILKRWQPYAGLIYLHLLVNALDPR